MPIDHTQADEPHEVRLEGFRLVASVLVLGGLVLAAVVGSFMLGRWVESRSHPGPRMAGDSGGPLAQVVAPEALDAEEGLDYFDGTAGPAADELALEPEREMREARPVVNEPAVVSQDSALAPLDDDVDTEQGAYFVQVFAGRDRDSAEQLVGKLQSTGYRVQMASERDGSDALYKVRVGGYPTDTRAREVTEILRSKGFTGAWVTRSD